MHNNNFQYLNNISKSFSTKFINGLFLDIKWKYTYTSSFAQIASATLSIISDPSKNTESQIFKTVWLGRHVANRVRNHCIVKTFVSGGSYPPKTEKKPQENNHLLSLLHILTQKWIEYRIVVWYQIISCSISAYEFKELKVIINVDNHVRGMLFLSL